MSEIVEGSKVQLKSGSCDLNVISIHFKYPPMGPQDEVMVSWFDDKDNLQAAVYPRCCLVAIGLSKGQADAARRVTDAILCALNEGVDKEILSSLIFDAQDVWSKCQNVVLGGPSQP